MSHSFPLKSEKSRKCLLFQNRSLEIVDMKEGDPVLAPDGRDDAGPSGGGRMRMSPVGEDQNPCGREHFPEERLPFTMLISDIINQSINLNYIIQNLTWLPAPAW